MGCQCASQHQTTPTALPLLSSIFLNFPLLLLLPSTPHPIHFSIHFLSLFQFHVSVSCFHPACFPPCKSPHNCPLPPIPHNHSTMGFVGTGTFLPSSRPRGSSKFPEIPPSLGSHRFPLARELHSSSFPCLLAGPLPRPLRCDPLQKHPQPPTHVSDTQYFNTS